MTMKKQKIVKQSELRYNAQQYVKELRKNSPTYLKDREDREVEGSMVKFFNSNFKNSLPQFVKFYQTLRKMRGRDLSDNEITEAIKVYIKMSKSLQYGEGRINKRF